MLRRRAAEPRRDPITWLRVPYARAPRFYKKIVAPVIACVGFLVAVLPASQLDEVRFPLVVLGSLALFLFVYSRLRPPRRTASLVAQALWRRLSPAERAAMVARARTGALADFVKRYPKWQVPELEAALREIATRAQPGAE